MTSSALYQQALLAHHQHPFGFELAIDVDVQNDGYNPACGDEITVQVCCQNLQLSQIAFTGDSCAICRASASLMCQHLQTKSLIEAAQEIEKVIAHFSENKVFTEVYQPLNAVFKFPIRKQCALLPWQTLLQCIKQLTDKENP